MNTKYFLKKLFSAAIIQFSSKMLILVIGVLLARKLGPENYGQYSFIISIITVSIIPAVAGIPQLFIREISKYTKDQDYGKIKGLLFWGGKHLTIVAVISYLLVVTIIGYFDFLEFSISSILFIFFAIPLKAFVMMFGGYFNAIKKTTKSQIISALVPPLIFSLSLTFLYFIDCFSMTFVVYANTSSYLMAFLVASYFFKNEVGVLFKSVKSQHLSSHWRKALIPFSLLFIMTTMNTEISILLLGTLSDPRSVGLFKVSLQMMTAITIIINSLNVIIAPQIADKKDDYDLLQEITNKSVRYSTIICLPCFIILLVYPVEFIQFIFGEEYREAASIIQIVTIGYLFNVIVGPVGMLMNMTGNEKLSIKVLLESFVLNIILLILLIPPLGIMGASLSISISMIYWKVKLSYISYKKIGIKTWIR
ncbi:hypothetical protein A9263_15200 [Vibrio cyclitrophicus]|uniref:oligosaccharide flippase family protein n=1 Tax=Vibrio cyclitrophicus TaxID=47951 RepID=UPI0007EEAB97|nr:oligosaccharide flippase family protein [Vibrio cyclitrophicus]OBT19345.1 hypothetical protein A9263_15200 [Vibrio cyclitrophicus]